MYALETRVQLRPVDLLGFSAREVSKEATGSDPLEAAQALRRHWRLGTGPIPRMVRVMEARGIKATIVAALITATVTVTKYASASVTSTPAPVVTVTVRPATTSSGKGTSVWTQVAAVMTTAFGIGTFALGVELAARRRDDPLWAREPGAEQPDDD